MASANSFAILPASLLWPKLWKVVRSSYPSFYMKNIFQNNSISVPRAIPSIIFSSSKKNLRCEGKSDFFSNVQIKCTYIYSAPWHHPPVTARSHTCIVSKERQKLWNMTAHVSMTLKNVHLGPFIVPSPVYRQPMIQQAVYTLVSLHLRNFSS